MCSSGEKGIDQGIILSQERNLFCDVLVSSVMLKWMNSPPGGWGGSTMATKLAKALKDLGLNLEKLQQQGPGKANSRQKAKKPSRKARKAINSMKRSNGFTMQGSSRMFETAAPVAVDCVMKNPVYLRVNGKVSHPDFGDGVRIEGRQLLVDITTTGSDTTIFGSSGTSSISSGNVISLSPDALNGRLALQARNYSRDAFRRVVLPYVPRVATTDGGQMVLAYSTDGAESAFASNSFQSLTSVAPNVVTPFRKEAKFEVTYTGDLSWFTEADTGTSVALRSTVQGQILGFPDLTSIGAIQHGWLWVEYMIDLYGQNGDYGFTVNIRSKEEKELVQKFLEKKRIAEKDVDTWSDVESLSGRAVRRH